MTLTAPTAGSTFTTTLSMAATASDNRGVSRVEFWFDGARVSRDSTAPYTGIFTAGRTTSYGVHTVAIRAFDAAGNARSTAVTVTPRAGLHRAVPLRAVRLGGSTCRERV